MSRQALTRKVQRKADTKKQKINASEVSRVGKFYLDEIERKLTHISLCIQSLLYDVSRAKRKVKK